MARLKGRLAGKSALITGGSRGIGKAIAVAFAREGCAIFLNGRDSKRLKETVDELSKEFAVDIGCFAVDVTDSAGVENMVNTAEEWNPIDILVNNAGIHKGASFLDYSFADFKDVLDTNVYSIFHVTQALLKRMVGSRPGRVINIASTAGKWGSRNQSAYNASKHAVVGLTRCLALEMAPHNILVNAICPWVVDTDMAEKFVDSHAATLGKTESEFKKQMNATVPLGRFIRVEEVAGIAVFLASEEASYINGQSWSVDGGYTML